jgi:hypothetical protein
MIGRCELLERARHATFLSMRLGMAGRLFGHV